MADEQQPQTYEAPEPNDELLAKLRKWYDGWDEVTADNRVEQALDLDYEHGKQWTSAEADELEKRGQPVLVFNRVKPVVDYLLGDEIRKRVDPKAFPRTPQHEDGAQAATDMLRYLDDATHFDELRSNIWHDLIVPGVAGAVVEAERDGDMVMPSTRFVAWDRCWWDPHSRRHDFSDAKYLGTILWMDIEDAKEAYPGAEAAAVLDKALSDARAGRTGNAADDTHQDKPKWVDTKRERIMIAECYWRHRGQWIVAHYCSGGFVRNPQPTGYLDDKGRNECSLKLASCFCDDDGNRYGIVRNLRGPQDEINKRRSKALHRLNTKQVIAEDGAVENPEDARQELARPDGWVTVQQGRMGSLQIQPSLDATQVELSLLQEAKGEIVETSTLGMVSDISPDASGRAQLVRQKAASVPMEPVFDRLRAITKAIYTSLWFRARQFVSLEFWMRVDDGAADKGFKFFAVNRSMSYGERLRELLEKGAKPEQAIAGLGSPEIAELATQIAQQVQAQAQVAPPEAVQQMALVVLMRHPAMQGRIVTNQIDQIDVDITIEEVPDTTIVEQEEYEELIKLAGTGVQLPPGFVKLVIKASQLRNKKELLAELETPPDPQQAQMQAQAAQVQMAQATATVDKTQAEAHRAHAAAAKDEAEVATMPAQAQAHQARAMHDAARAGQMMAQEPMLPPAIDRRYANGPG